MNDEKQPEKFDLTRAINIGQYTYSFKDTLKNKIFTYRCKYTTIYKEVIKINKENSIKYN